MSPSDSVQVAESISSTLWHLRLGHPHNKSLHQLIRNSGLSCSTFNSKKVCHGCQLGKSSRRPLHLSSSRSNSPLELVFSDVWGPASVLSNE